MKHTIVRWKTTLLWVWLIAYVVRLLVNNKVIHEDPTTSTILLILCGLVGLYLVAIVIYQSLVPNNRYTIAILGVCIILISHATITDTPAQQVFIGDIMKLIWVILVIIWPMKLLLSKKFQEKKQEEDLEIIEV